jgi:hypothetical protein
VFFRVRFMTVTVTRRDGGTDKYMRFGDAYVMHHDGTLDVIRGGANGRTATRPGRAVSGVDQTCGHQVLAEPTRGPRGVKENDADDQYTPATHQCAAIMAPETRPR